jgi:hypothetical protein
MFELPKIIDPDYDNVTINLSDNINSFVKILNNHLVFYSDKDQMDNYEANITLIDDEGAYTAYDLLITINDAVYNLPNETNTIDITYPYSIAQNITENAKIWIDKGYSPTFYHDISIVHQNWISFNESTGVATISNYTINENIILDYKLIWTNECSTASKSDLIFLNFHKNYPPIVINSIPDQAIYQGQANIMVKLDSAVFYDPIDRITVQIEK